MDKTQLIKDIQEIELKLAEMKKELETKEEKSFPQKGDIYFMVTATCAIASDVCETDDGRFQVFRTKEDAEKFYDVECARKRVKDEIKRLNDGWTPDWKNDDESKYFTRLVYNGLAIDSYKYSKDLDNSMYLRNHSLATKLINSHKDDLLLILGQ